MAELRPAQGRSPLTSDAFLADAMRRGWLTVPLVVREGAPARAPVALQPFPISVRTLDALHLASIDFLCAQRQDVALASYDSRMLDAAKRTRIATADI